MEKLDKVITGLKHCRDKDCGCEGCPYFDDTDCENRVVIDAVELPKTYMQRFYERSCQSCGNADYVHEYEIYLCRREDGCHWVPKGDV